MDDWCQGIIKCCIAELENAMVVLAGPEQAETFAAIHHLKRASDASATIATDGSDEECAHGISLGERCGTCEHETGRNDERLLPYLGGDA